MKLLIALPKEKGGEKDAKDSKEPKETVEKAIDFRRLDAADACSGEKIVIRILESSSDELDIDQLGYEPAQKRHAAGRHQAPLRHGAR
ncbi:hypothetical protein ACU4GD_36450 [Cupriavidus basilensis]